MCAMLGQFANPLDAFFAPLAHNIGGAELLSERDPLRVAAKQDDPVGAETLRCDHAAEPDGAVADDGDRLAGADLRCQRAAWWPVPITSVSVSSDGISDRRRRPAARQACHPPAEHAPPRPDRHQRRPSRIGRRGDNCLQALHGRRRRFHRTRETAKRRDRPPSPSHIGADRLDDADELMPHTPAGVIVRHRLVRPQIAAADRGAGDPYKRVCRVDQPSVGNILDPDIAGSIHTVARIPTRLRSAEQEQATVSRARVTTRLPQTLPNAPGRKPSDAVAWSIIAAARSKQHDNSQNEYSHGR